MEEDLSLNQLAEKGLLRKDEELSNQSLISEYPTTPNLNIVVRAKSGDRNYFKPLKDIRYYAQGFSEEDEDLGVYEASECVPELARTAEFIFDECSNLDEAEADYSEEEYEDCFEEKSDLPGVFAPQKSEKTLIYVEGKVVWSDPAVNHFILKNFGYVHFTRDQIHGTVPRYVRCFVKKWVGKKSEVKRERFYLERFV